MYINQWELYEHQSFEPYNIITPLEDIIHESNANETYYHHNIDIPIWNNEFCMTTKIESPSLLCQASKDQPTTSFQYGLESLMCSSDEDSISSSEKCSKVPNAICEQFQSPRQHKNVSEADSALDQKSFQISFQRTQVESCTNQDNKSSPDGFDFATSSNSDFKITSKGKRRLIWTKELHESFIMIVNQLGGPEKAKPKAILQMMGLDHMLTISHVKSHLQKYRSTLHMHKALKGISEEGKRTNIGINELQVKIQMQIEESRQLQLEVERSNQRQLEMQQNLQMVIEQQRKQLKLMLYQQSKRTKLKNNLDSSKN